MSILNLEDLLKSPSQKAFQADILSQQTQHCDEDILSGAEEFQEGSIVAQCIPEGIKNTKRVIGG